MRDSKPGAAIWLAAGVAAVVLLVAGVFGLLTTRHGSPLPTPAPHPAALAATLPAPTGRIVAPPQPADTSPVAAPALLTIPAIDVSSRLVRLGLTAAGALQVPSNPSIAGWYTGSSRPGELGPAVIVGHIDSYTGPGVFYRLAGLRRGDRVYVQRGDGTLAVFRVTEVRTYPKNDFPSQAVYAPTPDAELRLITCGGAFDASRGSYRSNVIVFAVMIT